MAVNLVQSALQKQTQPYARVLKNIQCMVYLNLELSVIKLGSDI